MKKHFIKGIAIILVLFLFIGSIPLGGFIGKDFDISRLKLSFFSNALDNQNKPDYSNLSINQYMSKLLLNHNYSGIANDYGNKEKTIYQTQKEYFMNLENVSASKVMYEKTSENQTFINSVAAWKVLTFDPSEAYENLLDEQGYYESILMSILDVAMKDSVFLDALNCQANKTILSLSKNTASLYSTLKTVDINSINLKNLNVSDWTDEEFEEICNGLLQDKQSKYLSDTIGDHLDDFKTVLKTASTAYDLVQCVSKYDTLSNLSESIKNVLHGIYINCPSSNTAMKNACKKVYEYTSEEMTMGQIAFIEAKQSFISNAFSFAVGELWSWAKKEVITALGSSLLVGMNIGQAIGKSISNFAFSTDQIIEQFFVIEALLQFENTMTDTVDIFANAYKANETEENADNYIQAIKMFFSTIDLDYDYAVDFVSIAREKGAWNTIRLWFGRDETVESYKSSVNTMRNVISSTKEFLTNIEWYKWDYEEDAPVAYDQLFNTISVSNTSVEPPYSNTEPIKGAYPDMNAQLENYFMYEYSIDNNKIATITKVHSSSNGEAIIPKDINGYAVRKIGTSAFRGCTGITSVVMPSTLNTIDTAAFSGCSNLSNVVLNNGLEYIGSEAFSGTAIEEVTIPYTVHTMNSENSSYYKSCFEGANQLKKVVFAEGMTNIPYYALGVFTESWYCTSVEEIVLPSTTQSIGTAAFRGCSGITSITLPAGLTTINSGAFRDCSSLNHVYYSGTQVRWNNITIGSNNEPLTEAELHCINAEPLTNVNITLSWASKAYNGSVQKPAVTVKNAAGETLVKGRDYTVTYPAEATKPGTYAVTVTGIGNYSGTAQAPFTIIPQQLDAASITRTPVTFYYNGEQQQPEVTVKNAAGKVLTEGTDYTVTYPTSVEVGSYMVRVDGIGNYTGTVRKTYSIKETADHIWSAGVVTKKASFNTDGVITYTCSVCGAEKTDVIYQVSDVSITWNGNSVFYNGSDQRPKATVVVKDSSGYRLKEGSEYQFNVSYSPEPVIAPGTYTVSYSLTLCGEKYTSNSGVVRKAFTIKPVEVLDAANVTRTPTVFYDNGKQQQPTVTVTNAAGKTLKMGVDYTVTYPNSIDPGSYMVKVDGIGNYTGTVRKTYTIKPVEELIAANVTRTPTIFYANGKQQQPTVTVTNVAGKTLTEGTDYTVTYPESIEPGSYMVKVDGINGYTKTIRKTYTIKPVEELVAANVTRTPTIFYANGKQQQPMVTVTNVAGKTLTEGVDYTVTYPTSIEAGSYTVKVDGINGYTKTIRKAYTIKPVEELVAANVTRTPMVFYANGKQQQPTVTVKNAAGKVLTEGVDYTVTYPTSIEAGSYMVKVDGINGYTKTIRKTYTIKPVEELVAANVTRTPTVFYANGKQQQPTVTVKNAAGKVLTEGVDYTVTYPTSIEAGSYMVRVDGINGYKKTIRKAYTIKPAREALNATRITRTPTSFVANGTQQQPTVIVLNAAGEALTEGVDYKVTYPTSVEIGSYMVRVDGINGYSGTVRKAYTIK